MFKLPFEIILFRRTNKGGGRGNGTRPRLLPIGRLMQRRMLWMSGVAEKILDSYECDKKLRFTFFFS